MAVSPAGRPGLAPLQKRALSEICRAVARTTVSELAVRLRVGRSSATAVMDDLLERGLVQKNADGTWEATKQGLEIGFDGRRS